MTKRSRDEYEGRQQLQRSGWDVQKRDSVAFNGGSETRKHYHAKAATAFVLRDHGYRVDSEVENADGSAEADIVAYGHDNDCFVVELETEITDDVTTKKLNQFYHGQPFRECFILEVTDAPYDIDELHEWVEEQLF